MALRGRIGGFAKAARHSPEELTRAARDGFLARFALEVDPQNSLTPEERMRRALAARRAHMARLAHKSSQARRRRSRRKEKATVATVAEELRDAPAQPRYLILSLTSARPTARISKGMRSAPIAAAT
jgi:hypothetical protein